LVQVAKVTAGLNFPAVTVEARALVRTMKIVEGFISVGNEDCKGVKCENLELRCELMRNMIEGESEVLYALCP